MNRREFLRDVFLFTAGFTASVPMFDISNAGATSNGGRPQLIEGTGTEYSRLMKVVTEGLGGMGKFVSPGDTVVIKPNIGWDRTVEQGANSHPLVVRALVEMALESGAQKVKVFDHTCNEKRRCYANSGIQNALKQISDRRVRLEHIDRRKFVPVDIKKGKSLTRWDIYRDALEADCYINVPVAKHHSLSRLTLGLKNSMGVIGGNRGSLHHDLGQKLADLATVVRADLTVIDATRMLLRNGPQGGRVQDVKVADTIIATRDPVAADAYATLLFGLQPDDIDSTVAAHRLGLGEIDPARIMIRKIQG
ncbi:DUF362 domain-containing protein [Desulfopila sp. IMCC35008]|uniref:DUF362 domain-containing protein n=1 Tax=Desulfopila sp. IMCC35008 TaxID=2653858 RepID=UPI0013D618BA|nr:DUF362 domain-containing protein [Desulfopila sp. IMCC35008]